MNNAFGFKYFFTLFLAGICALIFLPYQDTRPDVSGSTQLSSTAEMMALFSKTESMENIMNSDVYSFNEESGLNNFESGFLSLQYDMNAEEWNMQPEREKAEFETTPAELEKFDAEMSQVEQSAQQAPAPIPAPGPTEDDLNKIRTTNSCTPKSLGFQNLILKSPSLKNLITPAYSKNFTSSDAKNPTFNRMCVAFAMNSFNLPAEYYASCARGPLSEPIRGGVKPCVTDTMVNITYNTYMETMTCLGLNPKHVFPKLSNESGFLINTLGGGFDAGVSQMTKLGIGGANAYYDQFMNDIQAMATKNPKSSCARLLQYKKLISMAPVEKEKRCSMISPEDNPLKGFFYSALLNKGNMTHARRLFIENNFEARLKKLGYKNVNIEALVNIVGTMAYNAGISTSFKALSSYITLREKAKLPTSAKDFDFNVTREAVDVDGVKKNVLAIARANIRSPFSIKENPKFRKTRRLTLAQKINSSFRLSFPEHLIYQQHQGFNLGSAFINPKTFQLVGAPGYISFLKDKDTQIRGFLATVNQDPNLCSDPNFLKTSY